MRFLQQSLFVLLALCPLLVFGQWTKEVDSLIHTAEALPEDTLKVARYGTLYEKLMFTDSDRALEFAKLEHTLATKIDYKKGIAASTMHLGTYHENIGQMDSARYYYQNASTKFKLMGSPKGELFINHALASIEKKLGNYSRALAYHKANIAIYERPDIENTDLKGFNKIGAEYLGLAEIYKARGSYNLATQEALKALKFFEEIKHVRRTGNSLKELGLIEQKRGNFSEAIAYGLRAYAIYDDHDYNEFKSHTAIDIATSYLAMNRYDEALGYFENALQIGREFKFVDAEAAALIGLGKTNMLIGKNGDSEKFLTDGLNLHQNLGFKKEIASDLNALAELNLQIGNTEAAIQNTARAIRLSRDVGALHDMSESYRIQSRAFELQNTKGLALNAFKNFKSINDSIFNASKSQQIEELNTIYETEKKEQQIALQENEIVLLEEKQRAAALQNTLLIGGIIALVSLFGLLFYGIRQKMKRNKLEKEKVDAELAFKKKELTTHALNLARKNETLENLKIKAQELKNKEGSNSGYNQLINSINFDLQDDNNWQNFSRYFEEVHKDFNSNVKTKYPQISSNELRLLALLKMNLSSKEIANILNISPEGIKKARYRLRKKLNLTTEDSLQDLVLSL